MSFILKMLKVFFQGLGYCVIIIIIFTMTVVRHYLMYSTLLCFVVLTNSFS